MSGSDQGSFVGLPCHSFTTTPAFYLISKRLAIENVVIFGEGVVWVMSSLKVVDSRNEENRFSLGDSTDVPQSGNVRAGAHVFLSVMR